MAKRTRSRPSGKPLKIKQNFGLLAEDVEFLNQVLKERRISDPFGASKSQIMHDALMAYKRQLTPSARSAA